MRILDEKYRLFGVINPVDLVVLLVVVAFGVVAVNVLFGVFAPAEEKTSEPMEAVIVISKVKGFDPESIPVGDTVTNTKGGSTIGKVVAVDVEPMAIENPTATGDLKVATSTVFVDVSITLSGDARKTREGIVFGNVPMRVNRLLTVAGSAFEGEGRVTSISRPEE